VQGGLQTPLDEPPADPADGPHPGVEGLGDPGVVPGRAAVGLVGLHQDAGPGQDEGRRLPPAEQGIELGPLVGGQGDQVFLLRHRSASYGGPGRRTGRNSSVNSSVADH
jgi:hypothetical protein